MRKIFSCILAVLLLLNICPITYAEADGTLAGWAAPAHGHTGKEGNITLDNTYAKSGTYSAKAFFGLPYKANRYLAFTTQVTVKKGARYKYGLSVKAKRAGNVEICIGWTGRHSLTPLGDTFDWMDLSYDFENTSFGNGKVEIVILFNSATKAMWIDDVYFCEVKEDGTLGNNLVSNGTFDVGSTASGKSKENVQLNELYKLYQDIESRNTFTVDEIKQVLGAFKYVPVYEAKGINIDGDIEEWEGYPKFGLPTKPTQYQIYRNDAAKDIDAFCQYAYDKDNFYLAIHVIDDIFKEGPSLDHYWEGDSIQIAICDVGQVFDAEIGFAHHKETGKSTVHSPKYGEELLDQITLKTVQNGNELIYEASIPWSLRYEDGKLPDGFLFDIIVNDNDGKGRAYCVELAPGIAEGKVSTEFPYLEFMTGEKDCYAWIQGPDTLTQDEKSEFSYYLVNEGEEKKLTLTSSNSDLNESITVPAHSGIRRTVKTSFSGHGETEYKIYAETDDEKLESSFTVKVQPSIESFDAIIEDMDKMAEELQSILDKCAKQGISTDYETINHSVIKRFCKLLPEEVENHEYERAFYIYDACKELFEDAKEACESYMAGTSKPQVVTRYKTGEVTLDGRTIYATTETNGVTEKRPFFFTGYGHFELSIRPDLPVFNKNYGVNLVQLTMEPLDGFLSTTNDDNLFRFDPTTSRAQRFKEMFKTAEENDVQICLLLGLHVLGSAIHNAHPEIIGKSVSDVIVQHGDIVIHPVMKKLIKVHVKGTLDLIGDSPALNSICLTNEPSNNSNSDYYKPYWAQYITEIYKADINNLNKAYGTDYKSFLDVPMPSGGASSTRWFYDYKQFNDKVLAEFHKIITDCVKEYNPDIKVHAKIQGMATKTEGQKRNFLTYGTDPELFIPYSDYNGNDCFGMLYGLSTWELLEGMEFYDMQVGMNNAPCFNSEDHFIPDGDKNFEPLQADFVETSQWQGYMHAKAASTIWSWDRSYTPTSAFYGGIDSRPDCIAKVGKTNYDANRLSYEITSIVEKEPQIAIINSVNARVFSMAYANSMYKAYTNCLYNGQKVKFIVESQMDQLKNYKALIIPNLYNVKDSTVEAIKDYVDNGGKVVMLGEDCLKYNEYNEPRDEEIVNYIKSKSQFVETKDDSINMIYPTNDGYYDIIANLAKEIGEDRVYIIDEKTGERVKDVEFEYADHDGNIILNMVNYSYDKTPKQLKIYVNGQQALNLYNLRREYQLGDVIELQRYQPMLVKIGDNSSAPAPKELKIVIDGGEYKFDNAKPYIDSNSRTLVPIRFVSEAMSADVDWTDETVVIKRGGDVIEYKPGEYHALLNGGQVDFDTCGVLKNDRVFVPIRYIAELLSATVDWDEAKYTVTITSKQE